MEQKAFMAFCFFIATAVAIITILTRLTSYPGARPELVEGFLYERSKIPFNKFRVSAIKTDQYPSSINKEFDKKKSFKQAKDNIII